jgi:hypothetical protein
VNQAPEPEVLSEALRLAELGYHVFALAPGEKCPRADTHGAHDATSDEAQLAAWWQEHPDANLGLALDGVLVVDIDDPETPWPGDAERAAELQMTAGAIQETPRGVHLLFRAPSGVSINSTNGGVTTGVDIKTGAGSYLVLSPSVVKGKPYQWRKTCALDVPPDSLPLPPQWLIDEAVRASSASKKSQPAAAPVESSTPSSERVERARSYLASIEPVPVRGQRGGAMLWAARVLVRGFLFDDDSARPLLVEHNSRFDPPWPDAECHREIERKLSEARRLPFDKPDGWLISPESSHDVDLSQIAPAVPTTPPIERFRPFPIEALPDPVREYLASSAESINLHTASIALPLLAALASAVGNSRTVRIKSDWVEPCVLWSMIIARSGDAKSPGIDAAVDFLRNRDQHAIATWRRETREHEKQKKAAKAAKKKDNADEEPPPAPKRCTLQDTTIEAAAAALEANPRGLLLERDELAGFFASFDAYRKGGAGKDRPFWLAAHGARPYVKDRSTQPLIAVERAAVSITGAIQPGVLRSATSQTDRKAGLLARFLIAAPPSRLRPFSDKETDPALIASMDRLFDRLLSLSMAPDNDLWRPIEVIMTPDARAAFIDWQNQNDAECFDERDDDIRAALGKAAGSVARLALVMEVIKWAGSEPSTTSDFAAAVESTGPSEVTTDSVHRAIEIMDWCKAEARRVYAMLGDCDAEAAQREAVNLIEHLIDDHEKGISANELRKRTRRFQTSEEAERALDALVMTGLGEWTYSSGGTPGRPTKRFRFIDRRDETPRSDAVSGGFGYGDGSTHRNDAEPGEAPEPVQVRAETATRRDESRPDSP